MSESKGEQHGGFQIGTVTGNSTITAGGDIVARDKTTTTTTTTTTIGFKEQAQQDDFVKQLEEFRSALREIRTQLSGAVGLNEDAKDKAIDEINQHIKEANEVKEKAAALPVGQSAPHDTVSLITKYLDKAKGFVDGVTALGAKATDIATKVGPVIAKLTPILLSARHLIGL
jgi:predicted phage gp36 major capsid-like protein